MRSVLHTVVLMCFFACAAIAQTFPDHRSTTVNDFADLLPETSERALANRLSQLKTTTGVEMTVVTLPSQTPYAPGMTMEAFATALFNDWGVGHAQRNDGILVLVLPNDRAMRIELGAGFDQRWNDHAARIVERDFLPKFRDGEYALGILSGTEAVIEDIAIPFSEGAERPPADVSGIVVIAIAGVMFVLLMFKRALADMATRLRRCPRCGTKGSLRVSRRTITMATPTMGGQEEKAVYCTRCEFRDVQHWRTAMKSSGTSSGGRGSFGGGRSGGGGASGRW